MPLIDPVTNPAATAAASSSSGNKDWKTTLLGKTIGSTTNETSFARNDLPKECRVLQPNSFKTMDHKPDRLNVHVDDQGVVRDVSHG